MFVVTQNPAFSDAVRGFIHQTNETIAVVWLTSLAEARRRLAWNSPSMVVVDNFSGNAAPEDAVADIQAASPHSRILVLIEDAVRS